MAGNGQILAFMPHPDDIEILCAGTLIHLRNKGYTVHMATMTAGDGASMELPGEKSPGYGSGRLRPPRIS